MLNASTRLLPLWLCVATQLTGSGAHARTFNTTFPASENAISEGGTWLNGRTTGLDWSDVRTTPGFAFGTQTGYPLPPYDDSVAVLTGPWGRAQFAQATVKATDCTDASNQEVELYLHGTITAHSITGYEFNFRCSQSEQAYSEIVRWNGKLNDFTYLTHSVGPTSGVKDGDIVTAIIVGDVMESYINGKLITHAVDTTFRDGSPGIGFFFHKGNGGRTDSFGFSSFNATDSAPPQFPASSLTVYRLQLSQAIWKHRKLAWFGAATLVGILACTYFVFWRRRSKNPVNDGT